MEASVEVVSVKVASMEASVEASGEVIFVEAFSGASVEVASVEAFVEDPWKWLPWKLLGKLLWKLLPEASVEVDFMKASTAWKRGSLHGSFHGSFHELPPKL